MKSNANPEITLNAKRLICLFSNTKESFNKSTYAKIPTVVTSSVAVVLLKLFFFKSLPDYRNKSNTSLRN